MLINFNITFLICTNLLLFFSASSSSTSSGETASGSSQEISTLMKLGMHILFSSIYSTFFLIYLLTCYFYPTVPSSSNSTGETSSTSAQEALSNSIGESSSTSTQETASPMEIGIFFYLFSFHLFYFQVFIFLLLFYLKCQCPVPQQQQQLQRVLPQTLKALKIYPSLVG